MNDEGTEDCSSIPSEGNPGVLFQRVGGADGTRITGDNDSPAIPSPVVGGATSDEHASTRSDVERRGLTTAPDRSTEVAALRRELAIARTEKRWVDADEIQRAIEAIDASAVVVDLDARRAARG